MALNSLICADVLLRNCSLTHSVFIIIVLKIAVVCCECLYCVLFCCIFVVYVLSECHEFIRAGLEGCCVLYSCGYGPSWAKPSQSNFNTESFIIKHFVIICLSNCIVICYIVFIVNHFVIICYIVFVYLNIKTKCRLVQSEMCSCSLG